jgi:predicted DNA-binding transcriptional regulator AlpA
MELLTVKDIMLMLKMSKSKVYELTKERTLAGDLRRHPLPCVRIDGSVRFRRDQVEAWIEKLAAQK